MALNPEAIQANAEGWPDGVDDKEVAALEASMRGFGISAVPTFIFDRKFGVSGAHPPEALASAIKEALVK
jgi:predicted DsbA family dithiol-disulfide isomerase